MTDSSSCARSSPARPQLGLFVRSLSIRRSAAATRSRARSQSAMVYRRGFGRVRFLRGAFAALLARMAALSCFTMGPLRLAADAASQDIRAASRASYEVPSAVAVNNSLSALIVPLIWGKARIDLLVELVDDFDGRALWRRPRRTSRSPRSLKQTRPRAVAQRTLLEDRVWAPSGRNPAA